VRQVIQLQHQPLLVHSHTHLVVNTHGLPLLELLLFLWLQLVVGGTELQIKAVLVVALGIKTIFL
jgi:hypothetical protein